MVQAMKEKIERRRQRVARHGAGSGSRFTRSAGGRAMTEALEQRTFLSASGVSIDLAPAKTALAHVDMPLQSATADAVTTIAAIAIVNIPDPYLRLAIRQALHRPSGEITAAEMLSLTSLTSMHVHDYVHTITDLTGLEYAKNLSFLNLNYNLITDLTPLSGLTNLTSLHLYENQITNISPLAELTKLSRLDLGLNNANDISALKELTKMISLNLHGNGITDISALAGMKNLTTLDLRSNLITALTPLTRLTHLQRVDLRLNFLNTDIGSPLMDLLAALQTHGARVEYLPQ
jgi:hypothetical protein